LSGHGYDYSKKVSPPGGGIIYSKFKSEEEIEKEKDDLALK
jgi:hypothetical protein